MSATTAKTEQGTTLSDKLKVEWPVLTVMGAGLLYLATALGDIKALLVGLDTRQQAIERQLPSMQEQLTRHGERITRIEATPK